MSDEVLSRIVEQVRDARFFSLLVDETSDTALLSACAYIPIERKPALNGEVHRIARCAYVEIAVSKYACARVVSTC